MVWDHLSKLQLCCNFQCYQNLHSQDITFKWSILTVGLLKNLQGSLKYSCKM